MFTRTSSPPQRAACKAVVWLVLAFDLFLLAAVLSIPAWAQSIPREAQQHRLMLKREAQRVWGLDAPVATFAAQIHQESRWRADARSPVGAVGLAQFMPQTAVWFAGTREDLREPAPMNPTWAIRGLVAYDLWLSQRITTVPDRCQRMAYTLSAYNGGLGWVYKRQRLSEQPKVCLGATCTLNPGITAAAQRENEHYPRVILLQYEPLYAQWGPGSCS